MTPKFSLKGDAFVIDNYNEARPFSSFLPGIAGLFGKPMWVFYTNRGQCVSSFGVRNKNGAMLEFYPANKAYAMTPLFGFRTFLRFKKGGRWHFYEPFCVDSEDGCRSVLRVRAHEIELEETNRALGLRITVVVFNATNEDLPVLVRQVQVENLGRQTFKGEIADGLPQVVPFGLSEVLLKQMSRTMEAFAEVLQAQKRLVRPARLQIEVGEQLVGDVPRLLFLAAVGRLVRERLLKTRQCFARRECCRGS